MQHQSLILILIESLGGTKTKETCPLQSQHKKSGFNSEDLLQILSQTYPLSQLFIKNYSPAFPFLCKIHFSKFDTLSMNQAKRNQWPIPKLISRAIIKDLILTKAVIFSPFLKGLTPAYKRNAKKKKKEDHQREEQRGQETTVEKLIRWVHRDRRHLHPSSGRSLILLPFDVDFWFHKTTLVYSKTGMVSYDYSVFT